MNIQEALTALGYKEARPGRWLKPVGYHVFAYDMERKEWTNWFKNIAGKISCYEGQIVSKGDLLSHIKTLEAFTRISIGDGSSEFQLAGWDGEVEFT